MLNCEKLVEQLRGKGFEVEKLSFEVYSGDGTRPAKAAMLQVLTMRAEVWGEKEPDSVPAFQTALEALKGLGEEEIVYTWRAETHGEKLSGVATEAGLLFISPWRRVAWGRS